LIAARYIQKGEVIFTERALDAAQLGLQQNDGARVCGCQHCFKSLQPISCLLTRVKDKQGDVSSTSSQCLDNLPYPHLWPIRDDGEVISVDCCQADENIIDGNSTNNCDASRFVARKCAKCKAHFCSLPCHVAHNARMGSCCLASAAIAAVYDSLDRPTSTMSRDADDGDEDTISKSTISPVTPPLLLATRLFCALTQQYRKQPTDNKAELLFDRRCVLGQLCGESNDINALEMGEYSVAEDGQYKYSLESAYNALTNALALSESEKQCLALDIFHRICAIAARNCIAVTTKSPFKSYYADLVRKTGRNTPAHKDAISAISRLLGSDDGLTRGMDGLIEDLCAVRTVGLFPLTARMNHSCEPLCELQCQTFVDCRIDVTAKTDIGAGEELTISYIDLGPLAGKSATNTARRRRELQARYLFLCKCVRCID